METLSELLTLCGGYQLATGIFPPKRPVMRSFDIVFNASSKKNVDNRVADLS